MRNLIIVLKAYANEMMAVLVLNIEERMKCDAYGDFDWGVRL